MANIERSIQKLLNYHQHRTHSVDKNCSVEAVEARDDCSVEAVEARDDCSVEAVQARDG